MVGLRLIVVSIIAVTSSAALAVGPPTGVAAQGKTSQIVVSWSSCAGCAKYNVKRATVSGGPYSTVASNLTTTSFTNSVGNGTTYYYVVSALSSSNVQGANSTPVNAMALLAPTGLTVTAGNDAVSLSWQNVLNATAYRVKRSTVSGGPYIDIANPPTAAFTDNNVNPYVTYYYVVSATRGSNNQSNNSSQGSGMPFGIPIPPPSTSSFSQDHAAWVMWSASPGATSYTVKRSTTNGGPYAPVGTMTSGTTYLDESIENDLTYYYVVTATNGYGTSANSSQTSTGYQAALHGGQPTPANGTVGAIDAQFDVNSSGASTYTIPIKVPPGTNGMQPRLNLTYSSQAGYDGLAGVGFTLAGVASIERCPPTKAHDDVFGGKVSLKAQDRFCLDGMRLIKIAGANYGDNGAVYHTEAETWTKVVSEGTCSSLVSPEAMSGAYQTTGPCTFTATLKNGTVAKFAEPDPEMTCHQAERTNANSTRFNWPLTSITDLNGNKMTVKYASGGDSRCVPSRIDYTSNSGAGITAQRYVKLTYENRNNGPAQFVGGFRRSLGVRIAKIETHVLGAQYAGGDQLVKLYALGYATGSFSGRDRLTSVKECEAVGQCLPPTAIQWNADQAGAGPLIYGYQMPDPSAEHIYPGDFNGDGLADYFIADIVQNGDYTERSLHIADGNSQFSDEEWETDPSIDWSHGEHYYTLDYNGDGFTDLLHVDGDSTYSDNWELHHGNLLGLFPTPTHIGGADSELSIGDIIYPGDYDGDGKTELLTMYNPATGGPVYLGWKLFRWDGTTFFKAAEGSFGADTEWNDSNLGINTVRLHSVDVNGDGRVDFLATKRFSQSGPAGYTKWKVFTFDVAAQTFEATSFLNPVSPQDIWPHEFYNLNIGDFNGDGYSDVLVTGSRDPATDNAPPGYLVMYSTGKTFVRLQTSSWNESRSVNGTFINIPWGQTGVGPEFRDRIAIANLNDDGMDDVIASYNQDAEEGTEYNGVYFLRSTHVSGGLNGFAVAAVVQKPADSRLIVGDFDRDGLSDYVYPSVSGMVVFHSDKPDLVQHIVDGVGAETWVEHEVMYRGAHTKSQGAVYPVRDYVGPRYLATFASHKGEGIYYTYSGARTDVWGRGFLGFEKIRAQRVYGDFPNLEYYVETYYDRTYPTAGAIIRQDRCASPSQCMSRVVVTPEAIQRYPGVYSVHASMDRATERDLAASSVSFERERVYAYDAYDNLTSVDERSDTASSDPDMRKITTRVFANDPSTWKLGYLTDETVTNGASALLSKRTLVRNPVTKNVEFDGAWDDDNDVWLGISKTYTPFGGAEKLTDPMGKVTELEYDAYQFVERIVNPLGHVIEKLSDPRFGNVTLHTDENGQPLNTVADGYGRTTRIDGPNHLGQIVTLQKFSFTSSGPGFISQTFVRRHFALSSTPEWDWSEEWKDPWGRTVKTRHRGGDSDLPIVTQTQYMQRGIAWKTSQPFFEGGTPLWMTSIYDAKGRPIYVTLPDGRSLQTIYDDNAHLVHRVDATGTNTYETIDGRGNIVVRQDGLNRFYLYDYDALGRMTQLNQPGGLWTTNRYDSLGRKTMMDDSILGLREVFYDPTGHIGSESDANGNVIERLYDDLDRTLAKSYYQGGILRKLVTFGYDDPAYSNSIGRLSHVTIDVDAQVESTYAFSYDAYGHQTDVEMQIDGYDFHWAKTHDPAGKVVAQTYPDGSQQKVEYTPDNRLSRLRVHEFDDASGAFQTYAIFKQYDAAGRPGQLRHKNNVISCYLYDQLSGRMSSSFTLHEPDIMVAAQTWCDDLSSSPQATMLLSYDYTWDDDNNLQRIEDHIDSLRSQTFSYNARNELQSAAGIYGSRIYTYDDNGRLTNKDGVTFSFSGDMGKSTQVVASSAGLSDVLYDANGNMTNKTVGSVSSELAWDADDLLTRVSSGAGETTFAYEFTGKRIRKVDANGDTTYYAGADYEVVRSSTGERHTKYVRGPDGVLGQITRTGIVLAHTQSDRHWALASMYDTSNASGALQALGHCVSAVVVNPQSVIAVRLALLCLVVVAAFGVSVRMVRRRVGWARGVALWVAVILVAELTVPASIAHAALTPGANGTGVPVVGVFHFTLNQVASTTLYTNAAGTVVTRVEHAPFGELVQTASTGSDEFRPKFTGKELDNDTQLHYYGARYYDQALGRFVSADDRMGGDPQVHQSLNRYAYASNNPIIYNDPTGHFAWVAALVVTAVAMTLAALSWGTDGRIFSDPTNAFDSFSWERAIVGAWVALVSSMLTFGLGTFAVDVPVSGAMATKFSAEIGQSIFSALASGTTAVISEYFAGERDAFQLGLTFAFTAMTSMLQGLSSLHKGTGYWNLATRMGARRLAELGVNSIKAASGRSMTFDLMVVSLSYSPNGAVDVSPSFTVASFFGGVNGEDGPAKYVPADGPPTVETLGDFVVGHYNIGKTVGSFVGKYVNTSWAGVVVGAIAAPALYGPQRKVAPAYDHDAIEISPTRDTAGSPGRTPKLVEDYGTP